MTSAPLLVAEGLTVRLGDRTVLAEAGLVVDHGEVVALVGPNGAGKSTLLHLVAGDPSPGLVDGAIAVAGRPVGSWSPRALARRRAVLPQRSTLGFPFPVHEVVAMGRSPWIGAPEADHDDAIVAAALADTDTAHLADRPFTQLSGGEQARVSLARTLAQQTPLLLLDEPTASLDLRHQELVLEVARRHAEGGGAVVVVLHDLALAARHCDRLVLLARGVVQADGAPDDVLTAELVTDVYGHPVSIVPDPMNGHPLVLPHRLALATAGALDTPSPTTPRVPAADPSPSLDH